MPYSDPIKKKAYDKQWWSKDNGGQSKRKRFMLLEAFPSLECFRCGFTDWRALQIDHLNGGGHKERTASKNSQKVLLSNILNNPEKYQLLCANCNWIKRYENKEATGRGKKNIIN